MSAETTCRFRPPSTGRQVTWEITRFCNLFCDHCCTTSGPDVDRSAEPSTQVLVAAAAELADARVEKVQFSGGEPLLRDGFLDMLDAIDTTRVRVHLASNGYRLTDQILDHLVRVGLAKLSVSVDGGIAAHHDLIRRKKGAFERTMSGIGSAVEAGLHVGVSATVTPGNISSLETLVEHLAGLGVSDLSIHSVVSVGRATIHPELLFAASQAQILEQEVRRLDLAYGDQIAFDYSFGFDGERNLRGCPARERLLHIDPLGNVSPCSWLYKIDPARFTLGNLTDGSLRAIADGYCEALDRLRATDPERCIIPLAQLEAAV